MTVLSVQAVSKSFRSYHSEWHRFARWFGINTKSAEEHWVLRDISFDIHSGEAIGIVGQNGAGKSTLLKVITGTLQPTQGRVQNNGRVAAILELGMGFNPELTGRQNVYHAAGLMGFSVEQIQRAMPEIENFAEIGNYFDEAVRTYSSGMQMRVAFAVATAYRPEVLIVDEALSVGDAYFQHKSFDRIREFQSQGTTLLIVSHDRSAIQSLCGRAILLENGGVIRDGSPEEVFDFYNALIAERENSDISININEDGRAQTNSGTSEVVVQNAALINDKGETLDCVYVGDQVCVELTVLVKRNVDALVMGYGIRDRLGQVLFGTNTWYTKQVISKPREGSRYKFSIEFPANFGVGSYSIQLALTEGETHVKKNYEWKDNALFFSVINKDKNTFVGLVWNEPTIKIEPLVTTELAPSQEAASE
ncbi:MAG: ABC transporter ATP-binding protein [Halioglobus sp.]